MPNRRPIRTGPGMKLYVKSPRIFCLRQALIAFVGQIAMAIAKASKFYDKQKMRQRRMSSPETMSSSNGHGQGYTAPARSAGITGTSTSNMSSTPGRPNGTASESASATSPGPSMNPEEDRAAKVQGTRYVEFRLLDQCQKIPFFLPSNAVSGAYSCALDWRSVQTSGGLLAACCREGGSH